MTANRPKLRNTPVAAIALHILGPGFAHFYWREYLFGLFVFLVLLMAGALFILSLFVNLPLYAKIIIYGLPVLFYLISFGDLYKTVRRDQFKRPQSPRRATIIWSLAILYELIWPLAPVNFALLNAPVPFVMDSNNLAPIYREGDLLAASRLEYMLHTWLVDKPIVHALPDRFTIVRFRTHSPDPSASPASPDRTAPSAPIGSLDGPDLPDRPDQPDRRNSRPRTGIVLGLPGEEVEIVEGVVLVDGTPQVAPTAAGRLINGNAPPTLAGGYSLLIAIPEYGRVAQLYEIPLSDLIGKVEKLL